MFRRKIAALMALAMIVTTCPANTFASDYANDYEQGEFTAESFEESGDEETEVLGDVPTEDEYVEESANTEAEYADGDADDSFVEEFVGSQEVPDYTEPDGVEFDETAELYQTEEDGQDAETVEVAEDVIEQEEPETYVGLSDTHVHKYTAHTDTITHPATGHYERVIVRYDITKDEDMMDKLWVKGDMTAEEIEAAKIFETHVVCTCGEWLDVDENGNWLSNKDKVSNIGYHCEYLGHSYESDRIFIGYKYPVFEEQWVEDAAAWTETKTTYTCEACGAFRNTPPVDITTGQSTTAKAKYDYTGNEIKPSVTVKVSGKTLKEGTDYILVYSNNKEEGTATVTANGRGGYEGSVSTTFKIAKIDLSNAEVTTYHAEYGYTGLPRSPHITVKLNGATLTENQDFTVEYHDNKDIGTATAFVTGIGKYTGRAACTFKIVRFDIGKGTAWTDKLHEGVYGYSGTEKTPHLYVMYDNTVLTKDKDYTLSYKNNIEVGIATVTATGIGMYQGTISANFKIVRFDIGNGTAWTNKSHAGVYSYSGTEKTPHLYVKYGNTLLKKDKDYTLSYKNNIEVGTATVTAIGIGTYRGTISADFKIQKTDVGQGTITIPNTSYVYNGKEQTPKVTLTVRNRILQEGKDYTLTYENNKNIGTASILAKGIGIYDGVAKKTFDIVSSVVETVPVYRMFNKITGEHFYTTSAYERQVLVGTHIWNAEGIAWYSPKTSSAPVYRLCNPNSNEHHYTCAVTERDWLRRLGWRYEGIAFYSDTTTPGRAPVYRHYHPIQRTGNHHYTTSKGESDHIIKYEGWRREGISWYVTKAGG